MLSDVASPQVQIEPLDGHGDVARAHAEEVCQVAEEIQVQVTGRTHGIPLDDVQQGSTLCDNPSNTLAHGQKLGPSHATTLFPFSVLPTSISPILYRREVPLSVPCVMPIKQRVLRRKAVVINEDTVHASDENGDGGAKSAQKKGERVNPPTQTAH